MRFGSRTPADLDRQKRQKIGVMTHETLVENLTTAAP